MWSSLAIALYVSWVGFYESQSKNSIGKPCEGKLHARFEEGGSDCLCVIINMSNQALLYS